MKMNNFTIMAVILVMMSFFLLVYISSCSSSIWFPIKTQEPLKFSDVELAYLDGIEDNTFMYGVKILKGVQNSKTISSTHITLTPSKWNELIMNDNSSNKENFIMILHESEGEILVVPSSRFERKKITFHFTGFVNFCKENSSNIKNVAIYKDGYILFNLPGDSKHILFPVSRNIYNNIQACI